MTTELRKRGIFTKTRLKGYLKNITTNEMIMINTVAIKTNQKISYYLDKEKYILNLISPSKLILSRENSEIEVKHYFELNKVQSTSYKIKENNLFVNIDIITNYIKIDDKHIKIVYTVVDSNINYEYYIEMSEYI